MATDIDERDPAEADYRQKFNKIAGSPDNLALGDQAEANARDNFVYTGDEGRDSLAAAERSGSTPEGTKAAKKELKEQRGVKSQAKGRFASTFVGSSRSKTKKRIRIWLFGTFGSGTVLILLFLIFMLASGFGVKQLAIVVKNYGMYRLNRLSHNVTTRLIEGDIRVKSGNGLSSVTPGSNIDKIKNGFDIEKVLKTLEDENTLKYVRDADNKITGIIFNDSEEIALDGLRANPLKRADAYNELSESIRKFSPELAETSTLVGKTSDGVFERVGARRLRWSEKQLAKLRSSRSPKEALGIEQAEQLDDVVGDPKLEPTGDPEIDEAAQAADENVKKVAAEGVDNPVADVVDEQIEAMGKSSRLLSRSAAGELLEGATAVVVYSLCTVNAVNNSYPATLRQSNDAASRLSVQLQAASDQISQGAMNAAAVGAARESLGDFGSQAAYQMSAMNPNWKLYRELPEVDTPQPRNDRGWMKIFANIAGATNTAWNASRALVGGQIQENIPILNDVSPAAWTFTEFCSKINTLAGGVIFGLGTALIEQAALNAVWPGGGGAAGATAGKEAAESLFTRLLTAVTEKGISGIIREAIEGTISKVGNKISDLTIKNILGAFAKKSIPIALETGALVGMTYLIIKLANGVSGNTYTGTSDQDYANKAGAGTNLTQASLLRTRMYGVPTDAATNISYRKQQYADYVKEQSSKSLADRMLDPGNPYSAVSRVAVYSPYDLKSAKSFAINTLSPVNILSPKYALNLIGSKIAPDGKAFAESPTSTEDDDEANNNIQQWGYTLEEEELMKTDEYSLESISNWAETPEGKQVIETYDVKYGACYSTKNEMSDILLNEDKSGLLNDGNLKDRCLKELPDENKLSKDLFRWRLYRTDVITIDEAIDLQTITAPTASTEGDGDAIKAPGGKGSPVDESETEVTTGCGGIRVHKSIVSAVNSLCDAAKADGLNLTGSGWRDPQEQIALRKKNCGTSNYAIYEMPSGQCHPPTAKPGSSQHEAGLAIDFRNCSSRGSQCYKWLAANAARFGFFNFPPEPWHWSTTGN